jgi:threonine/homoserine/homoserine lactone efflux protein
LGLRCLLEPGITELAHSSLGLPFLPLAIVLFLKGLAVGVVVSLPAGPIGLLCVQRTLFEGALFGIVSALGAALADMAFGLIAGMGLTVVRDWLLDYEDYLAIAGGLYLLFVGIRALVERSAADPQPITGEKLAAAFASTFMLSISNPVTLLAFAVIFAKVGFEANKVTAVGVLVLVAGVLLGALIWWLGLTLSVAAVKRFARTVHLSWISRVSGTILTLCGFGLIGSVMLAWLGYSI